MTGALPDPRAHERLDFGLRLLSVDQQAEVLLGGQPHHDSEAVLPRDVEQGARRHRVRDADGVDATRGHLREVRLDDGGVVILAAVRVRAECPVGDAAHEELVVTDENELAAHLRPEKPRREARPDDL